MQTLIHKQNIKVLELVILTRYSQVSSSSLLSEFQDKKQMLIFNTYNTVNLKEKIYILGQVWYLIVSTPDLCTLTYFNKDYV